MNTAGGGQNDGTAGSESEAHQPGPATSMEAFPSGVIFTMPRLSGQRSRHIEISVNVKSQSLRAPQATEESRNFAVRIDLINRIKAGSGGTRDEKISVRTNRQMVSGNAGLKGRENKNLAVARDFENGSAAVADVKILRAIERDAGGHTHSFGIGRHRPIGGYAVHRAFETGRNVHLSCAIESDCGGIHHVREKWFDFVAGVNFVNRDWNFLPTRAGKSDVDIPFGIQGRIGHRMQFLGNGRSHLNLLRIAGVPVCRDYDSSGRCALRHAGDRENRQS